MYNAENYIADTLESIVNQIYSNMEIIIINDGSNDDSISICDIYKKKYPKIKIYNKKNGGLSSARNAGIDIASGEYIWFVDSDDLAVPGIVKNFMYYIKRSKIKPDILFSNYKSISKNNYRKNIPYLYDTNFIQNCTTDQLLYYFYGQLNVIWGVWCHIYRTAFIKNNQLYFNQTLNILYEDLDWLMHVILAANHYDSFTDVIYMYRTDNMNSVTNRISTISLKAIEDGYKFTTKWFRQFENDCLWPKSRNVMLKYFSDHYKILFAYIGRLPVHEKREALQLYKSNIDIANFKIEH